MSSPPAPILGSNAEKSRKRESLFLLWLPSIGAGGLILLVRLIALNSDPPAWLSWSTGLYTDEGFYTLDARHEALFGMPAPGNFHDRLLAPVLSVMQQAVFALFGPSLLSARLLSVVFGLLTVAVFWLALRRASDARTADLGVLFLGLAPPFALYNRLALQETPTVFWLTLGFLLWAQGRGLLSGAALGLACVFKGVAVAAGGVLGVGVPPAPNNGGVRAESKRFLFRIAPPLLGAGGTLLLYFVFWYGPHHTELSRMATFYRVHQMQPHSVVSLWLNVKRGLIGGERGVIPYLLASLPVPCLLAARTLGKWRRWTQADKYLAVWLGGGLLFCLLSSYAPSRYFMLFLPPLAGLAARSLTGWKRPAQLVIVGVFLVTSGLWYGTAWVNRSNARGDASRALAQLLPPGSVVVGEFAPALCLDTKLRSAPVQPGLSNDDRPVEHLNAAAVVVTRKPYWETWWQSRYPQIVQPSHRIATFTLGGSRQYVIDVYRVK